MDQAIRYHFSGTPRQIRLISHTPIETISPPSDETEGFEGESGFWVELRDASERTLYRRVLHNPWRGEAIGLPPGRRPEAITEEERSFLVLLPNLPQSVAVVVFGSPAEESAAAQSASEVARFPV